MKTKQLHDNWQLCNAKKQDWIPAQVPGDIYFALLAAGKMEDPFFGDNEYQAKALMEEDYEYKTVFDFSEKEFLDKMIKILAYQSKKKANRVYKKKIKKLCESL